MARKNSFGKRAFVLYLGVDGSSANSRAWPSPPDPARGLGGGVALCCMDVDSLRLGAKRSIAKSQIIYPAWGYSYRYPALYRQILRTVGIR